MSVAVQPYPIPLTLSANLVSALNNPRSVLRTVAQRDGSTVTVYVGGEVDAANEHSWQQLLREAAAATPPPGPLVIDTDGLDFMGCCAFTALAGAGRPLPPPRHQDVSGEFQAHRGPNHHRRRTRFAATRLPGRGHRTFCGRCRDMSAWRLIRSRQ